MTGQGKRMLQIATDIDTVTVTEFFGNNANMVDTTADVLPPLGTVQLDTASLISNFGNIVYISIISLLGFVVI
jgi:hypothetical protein